MADTGYFANEIIQSQGDGVGLKMHHMYDINNDDFHFLKPGLMSRRTLNALHHYTAGRAVFVPTQMPKFMEWKFPKETNFVRQIMLVAVNRWEFAQDKNADIATVETGVEGQAKDYISKTTGRTRECTLGLPAEFDGGIITQWSNAWIEGMQSSYDGVMSLLGYPGSPSPANYSMEGMYITLDPTETIAVYAAFVMNMIIKNAQLSIFNATKGEYSHQELSMQFACQTIDDDDDVMSMAQLYINRLNSARNHNTRLQGDLYPNLNIEQSGDSVI